MPKEDKNSVTLRDLKNIIHGLKMSTLSFVEDDAIDAIKERINNLPSSEKLDQLSQRPQTLKYVRAEIGEIMRLIEFYGQRNSEFKSRYKSRTGLPPRYKIMDFVKQQSVSIIKEIIKTSSEADNKGQEELAENLIKFAKKIQNDNLTNEEWEEMIEKMDNFGYSSSVEFIVKTSGLFDIQGRFRKKRMKDLVEKAKFITKVLDYQFKDVFNYASKIKGKIKDIEEAQMIDDITQVMYNLQKQSDAIKIQINNIEKGLMIQKDFNSVDEAIEANEKFQVTKGSVKSPIEIRFANQTYRVQYYLLDKGDDAHAYIQDNVGNKYYLMDDLTLQKATSLPSAPVSSSPAASPTTSSLPSSSVSPPTTATSLPSSGEQQQQ